MGGVDNVLANVEESFDEYEKLKVQEQEFRKAICAKYKIVISYSKRWLERSSGSNFQIRAVNPDSDYDLTARWEEIGNKDI